MKKQIAFKTKPYQHQVEMLKYHLMYDRTGDWSDCGVGKTWVAINKINGMIKSGRIRSCLVLCPNSVMKSWKDELRKHSDLSFKILDGDLENKLELLKSRKDVFVCSFDSVSGKRTRRSNTKGKLLKALLNKRFGMLVADEVSLLGNRNTDRVKAISVLCDVVRIVLFMSGTLVSNQPENVLTIYRLLDKKVFGDNFFQARAKYFVNIGFNYPNWVFDKSKLEEFIENMYACAIRIKKEECLDLPDKVDQNRYTGLTNEQFDIYSSIAKKLMEDIDTPAGTINIRSAMTRMTKLSQITSGFLYTEVGGIYNFDPNPKILLLKECIEEHGGDEKIIIYTTFTEEINMISDLLKKMRVDFVCLKGGVTNKSDIIDDFLDKKRVLVCNIGVGGYGLTLTASHVIIYYSTGFSIDKYSQSRDRIHRLGQTQTCFYKHLMVEDTVDEYIRSSLIHNIKIKEAIINGDSRLKENIKAFIKEV